MARWLRLLLIALGVLAFLVISALLARALSIDGAEQAAITHLVQDEARGDARGMTALIAGCRQNPACRTQVARNAAALRRPGRVSILQVIPSAGFSLTGTLGTARVAWRAGNSLPVTQCVRVRRAGDVISGLSIQLLAIGPRIKTSGVCHHGQPARAALAGRRSPGLGADRRGTAAGFAGRTALPMGHQVTQPARLAKPDVSGLGVGEGDPAARAHRGVR